MEASAAPKMISFARGVPAPECLAVDELADCARAVIEQDGKTILSYGSAAGYTPLREYIGQWFGVNPFRVVITNGALQGFVLLAQHLARAGGTILVERPTYDRALKIARGVAGSNVLRIDTDEEGIVIQSLENKALRAGLQIAFLYTIPTFQNPTGRTMSEERRRELVSFIQGSMPTLNVIEDDPYGLIRFEGTSPPKLFDLADQQFIYTSSFSKTISPGLRVGWYILPEQLAKEISEVAADNYITPVLLSQAIAYEFIRRGHFESNLERVNGLLRERRDAMMGALEKHLSGRCTWTVPEGGYFVWLEFPEDVETADVLDRCEGVTYVPGPEFGAPDHTARLAYSFVSPEEIEIGIERIAAGVERAADR